MLALSLAGLALIDHRRHRGAWLAAALFAALLVAAFAIDTPVGHNAARLGVLAGPAVLLLVGRGPRTALALTAIALVYLQWLPAVRALHESRNDPATSAAFHQPLIDFLEANASTGDRVEIPLTRNHWEAAHVAKRWPIARGWERQLDRRHNALFYDDRPLSAGRYEAWLAAQGIRWVALPQGSPLDFSAKSEARLIRSRPSFLRPAGSPGGWQVFEVAAVAPSPVGAATADSVVIEVREPGRTIIKLRHSRHWRITAGRGCVSEAPGGWTAVEATEPGSIRLQTRLSGDRCR